MRSVAGAGAGDHWAGLLLRSDGGGELRVAALGAGDARHSCIRVADVPVAAGAAAVGDQDSAARDVDVRASVDVGFQCGARDDRAVGQLRGGLVGDDDVLPGAVAAGILDWGGDCGGKLQGRRDGRAACGPPRRVAQLLERNRHLLQPLRQRRDAHQLRLLQQQQHSVIRIVCVAERLYVLAQQQRGLHELPRHELLPAERRVWIVAAARIGEWRVQRVPCDQRPVVCAVQPLGRAPVRLLLARDGVLLGDELADDVPEHVDWGHHERKLLELGYVAAGGDQPERGDGDDEREHADRQDVAVVLYAAVPALGWNSVGAAGRDLRLVQGIRDGRVRHDVRVHRRRDEHYGHHPAAAERLEGGGVAVADRAVQHVKHDAVHWHDRDNDAGRAVKHGVRRDDDWAGLLLPAVDDVALLGAAERDDKHADLQRVVPADDTDVLEPADGRSVRGVLPPAELGPVRRSADAGAGDVQHVGDAVCDVHEQPGHVALLRALRQRDHDGVAAAVDGDVLLHVDDVGRRRACDDVKLRGARWVQRHHGDERGDVPRADGDEHVRWDIRVLRMVPLRQHDLERDAEHAGGDGGCDNRVVLDALHCDDAAEQRAPADKKWHVAVGLQHRHVPGDVCCGVQAVLGAGLHVDKRPDIDVHHRQQHDQREHSGRRPDAVPDSRVRRGDCDGDVGSCVQCVDGGKVRAKHRVQRVDVVHDAERVPPVPAVWHRKPGVVLGDGCGCRVCRGVDGGVGACVPVVDAALRERDVQQLPHERHAARDVLLRIQLGAVLDELLQRHAAAVDCSANRVHVHGRDDANAGVLDVAARVDVHWRVHAVVRVCGGRWDDHGADVVGADGARGVPRDAVARDVPRRRRVLCACGLVARSDH